MRVIMRILATVYKIFSGYVTSYIVLAYAMCIIC